MQYTQQAATGGTATDGCAIKVTVEFSDERKSAMLEQMPLVDEALKAVCDNMPTEAVSQMQQEQKMKHLSSQLSFVMSGILSSAIATEHY
jgi:hypothetical protein